MNGSRGQLAAFFDMDGTLIGVPSLERRFFEDLRYRGAIPRKNYLLWLARAMWLAPRGMQAIRQGNKRYLRGVSVNCCEGDLPQQGPFQGAPRFFPQGVNQVAWHARQGHTIVLVTGTLAPLAQEMALALVFRLVVRGIEASIAVCATQLEEKEGRWTGEIVGEAMFGEAKARAVRRLAKDGGFALQRCYAYGDSWDDRWMLETVGRPVAVNPSPQIERLARQRDWAVVAWAKKELTRSSRRAQRARSEALLVRGMRHE